MDLSDLILIANVIPRIGLKELEVLVKDYKNVRDITLEETNKFKEYNPRCHETAYLINEGLKSLGYNSKVEDGICPSLIYLANEINTQLVSRITEHSWIKLNLLALKKDNSVKENFPAVIDIRFECPYGGPIWTDEIIIGKQLTENYEHRKIGYSLLEGTEDIKNKILSRIN